MAGRYQSFGKANTEMDEMVIAKLQGVAGSSEADGALMGLLESSVVVLLLECAILHTAQGAKNGR